MTTIGFQIRQRRRMVPGWLVDRYRDLPVANVSDCMSRLAAGGHRLRPLHGGGHLCGPAITVRTRPGDNLMVHAALDLATEGDVVVVDAGGDLTNAVFGELMLTTAIRKNLGGIVINGAVRDYAAIRAQRLPVYAAGITHRGPYKDGPGEVNVTIAIDGMTVAAGDLIIGDDDGVLCVPVDDAEEIYVAAHTRRGAEQEKATANSAGTGDTTALRDRLSANGRLHSNRDRCQ